jgi:simple sugar transport system permease protein
MGRWRPVPTALACLLFGFADALEARLQGAIPGVPVQLVAALPYILAVLVLAGFIGRAEAPRAIGMPFVKTR